MPVNGALMSTARRSPARPIPSARAGSFSGVQSTRYDRQLHHVLEAGARGVEGGGHVEVGLLDLCGQVTGADRSAGLVDGHLPRDVDGRVPGGDRHLVVEADHGQTRGG